VRRSRRAQRARSARRVSLAIAALFLAGACSGQESAAGSDASDSKATQIDSAAITSAALVPSEPALYDSVSLTLATPTSVRRGQQVPLVLSVRNVSRQSLTLKLGAVDNFDLVVERPDGSVVWRRLDGRVVTLVQRRFRLDPEGGLERRDSWDQRRNDGQPVPPGRYQVRGELPNAGPADPWLTPSKQLVIEP
jgi:hypothetical protein